MLVASSLLLKSLGPVYPLIGPTSKCGYVGQVVVVSDHQEGFVLSEINNLVSYADMSR